MGNTVEQFAKYLSNTVIDKKQSLANSEGPGREGPFKLRDLWERSELSANEFADEVARFYGLRRISLPQMMAASSLAGQCSRRFLREAMIFPFQSGDGPARLAVSL